MNLPSVPISMSFAYSRVASLFLRFVIIYSLRYLLLIGPFRGRSALDRDAEIKISPAPTPRPRLRAKFKPRYFFLFYDQSDYRNSASMILTPKLVPTWRLMFHTTGLDWRCWLDWVRLTGSMRRTGWSNQILVGSPCLAAHTPQQFNTLNLSKNSTTTVEEEQKLRKNKGRQLRKGRS